MSRGKFIAIDGTDGSGKEAQVNLLVERLQRDGYNVAKADFPRYTHWSSEFVKKYLHDEFGKATDVPAKTASIFYAVDRYAASFDIRRLLEEGNLVIANRYTAANKGHQLGKIKEEAGRREFLAWLNDLEYRIFDIPIPDLTLFLHMDAAIGQRLAAERDSREGKKLDSHQRDINHLRKAEEAYLFCLENDTVENWRRIVCFADDAPSAIPVIHEEVYRVVKEIL